MKNRLKQYDGKRYGSVLILAVVVLMILSVLGVGMLAISYGVRHQAIMRQNETVSMLAAEAGYEKAIFWMSQQQDMLTALHDGVAGTTGNISFLSGNCDYSIEFYSFIGTRPVYRIVSNGHSGMFDRTVDVLVIQAVSGWDMGMCRIPNGPSSTQPVYFVNGEIIDMPLHINNFNDNPDSKDIYILGVPQFLRPVAMGESRYTADGADKYNGVMDLFTDGIYFDQPDSRVTDEASVQSKLDRFRDSTNSGYQFTPTASASVVGSKYPAVQLEFFVEGGVGKVCITNNCTVKANTAGTYDYSVVPGSGGTSYQKYNIYAYHFKPDGEPNIVVPIENTYVSQTFGGCESEPGGQIFVDGSIVIGSSDYQDMVVKGKITLVATGNIWVADSVKVDDSHDASGVPSADNPNILGLIANGVVKVVDPGLSPSSAPSVSGQTYQPIGITKSGCPVTERHLPDPTIVEAAITVGGGGWGAENVGNRREFDGSQDYLVVRGSITEVIRGVVGMTGSDGYLKNYYLDERLLEGFLPGDIWLQGKYIPAPAGWHDYRN